jgi:hypothetical protein
VELKSLFVLGLAPLLTSCLYPSLPADPREQASTGCTIAGDAVRANYECAVRYARESQKDYRCSLQERALASEGLGLLLIGAGGAALGIGAAGVGSPTDTTLAVTQLGIGGGTLIGAAAWSENKSKTTAYLVGYTAIQCVLDQATQLAPAIKPI